jgi:tetratricopeptide (TPR) repeat protein
MREVWSIYQHDSDVGALTAEAIMELRPFDYWTPDGKPQPGTEQVLSILDRVLADAPEHPYGLHLLIHILDCSPFPERADAAADRLRTMTPGIEHLLHMPSHIDITRGRWLDAMVANERAIAADHAYRRIMLPDEHYLYWVAHNYHMLAYAAMMLGESSKATQTAREMLSMIPAESLKTNLALADMLFSLPYDCDLRFGRWKLMLAAPAPPPELPVTTALWHYARGISFAAMNDVTQATAEQRAFKAGCQHIFGDPVLRKCAANERLPVAAKMLEGELLYRAGKVEQAIRALREAAEGEDALSIREPPMCPIPSRHALGATLLDCKQYANAEVVYRADLARHPDNGWALYGLARSLELQHRHVEASVVRQRFERAWEHADVRLTSSCCCLRPQQ